MGLSSLRRYHDRPGAVTKALPSLVTREVHEAALYAQGKAYEAKLTALRVELEKVRERAAPAVSSPQGSQTSGQRQNPKR